MRTGAARDQVGNFHEAGVYRSDGDFLKLIVPFVTDGIAADEPVVIGYDRRKCDLLRAELPPPDVVKFHEDASLYASPARAIQAYRQQFERQVAAGAGQIRIAGDVPHEGTGGRFAGWDRYESAVNAVWQDYPVWSRCLYDATTVSDEVRDVVERTHRRLVTPDGGASASPRYQEVTEFEHLPATADPLEATPPTIELTNVSLKRIMRAVSDLARGRISAPALDELPFAVSEAVINAELYGRPPTTVRVWAGEDRIVVHVHDRVPGPANGLAGLVPVADSQTGAGLGLWLSHQLAEVDIALIATDGFTVRLRSGPLPRPEGSVTGTFPLRAGTASGAPPHRGTVHALDGDGSSFCNRIAHEELVRLDRLRWSDIPEQQRCPECQVLLDLYG